MDAERTALLGALDIQTARVIEAHDLIRGLLRAVSVLEHDRKSPLRDQACQRCVGPDSDSLVAGFVCMKHRARDLVGA